MTGRRVPPSASTLDRLGDHLDPDELEAALTGLVAGAALDPAAQSRAAAARPRPGSTRRRGGAATCRGRAARDPGRRLVPGGTRPPVAGPGGHRRPRSRPGPVAVAVDGGTQARQAAEEEGALLGVTTSPAGHRPGQGAKSGRRTRSRTSSRCWNRCRCAAPLSRRTRCRRPGTTPATRARSSTRISCGRCSATSPACTPPSTPWTGKHLVAAATSEITRGRVETRTIRVLPVPDGLDFPYAEQAILIERYVTVRKNGRW